MLFRSLISNVESYSFSIFSAFYGYAFIWELEGKPRLAEPELLELLKDLPSNEGCMPPEMMEFIKLQLDSKPIISGYLLNTCREIEGPYLDLLKKTSRIDNDKQWAVGL